MDINGAVAGKVAKVLSLLDIPWPGGDPAALRQLAGEWRSMSVDLSTTAQRLDGQVHQVVGSHWTGAAADAFVAHWQQQHQAMVQSAENFRTVAKELDVYADQAEQIIEAIVEIPADRRVRAGGRVPHGLHGRPLGRGRRGGLRGAGPEDRSAGRQVHQDGRAGRAGDHRTDRGD